MIGQKNDHRCACRSHHIIKFTRNDQVKSMTAHLSRLCNLLLQAHRLEKLQKLLPIEIIGNFNVNIKIANNEERVSTDDD